MELVRPGQPPLVHPLARKRMAPAQAVGVGVIRHWRSRPFRGNNWSTYTQMDCIALASITHTHAALKGGTDIFFELAWPSRKSAGPCGIVAKGSNRPWF